MRLAADVDTLILLHDGSDTPDEEDGANGCCHNRVQWCNGSESKGDNKPGDSGQEEFIDIRRAFIGEGGVAEQEGGEDEKEGTDNCGE